ncbi:MAG: glutamyl-tRNA reductase [Bacteroidetes bacterium]|nr:MAG: glutamyl-tRNA reductase [Bacteroidota bacterium]
MLQHYKILTVTHQRTNLKKIGRFAIAADNEQVVANTLAQLQAQFNLSELFYAATCNRVLFLFTSAETITADFVQTFFQTVNPALGSSEIAEEVMPLAGMEVVEHLYRVGASMDSLVIGERQILGQLREAYEYCQRNGFIGDDLRLLFQRMVLGAKDVYANTRIGDKPVSVASLAVKKLLKQQVPTDARILLIGAGQTNNLVSKFLLKHHFTRVTVFNRSIGRAKSIAEKFAGWRAFTLDELLNYGEGFDCIVVCTGASEPILTSKLYHQLLAGEQPTGKVIVDLAIPHNTAPSVLEDFAPVYIEIEGLRQLAADNIAFRGRELERAKQLLEQHILEYPTLYKQRQLERALHRVPQAVREVRERAVNEVFRKDIEQLDDQAQAVLDQVLAYMEKKCIGIPMRVARETLLS